MSGSSSGGSGNTSPNSDSRGRTDSDSSSSRDDCNDCNESESDSREAEIREAKERIEEARQQYEEAREKMKKAEEDIELLDKATEMLEQARQELKEAINALIELVQDIDFSYCSNMKAVKESIVIFVDRITIIMKSFDAFVNFTSNVNLNPLTGRGELPPEQLLFLLSMDMRFPGLREILDNPHASLYLNGNMYRMALDFLQHQINQRGQDIHLMALDGRNGLQEAYILSAISHLVAMVSVREQERFLYAMYTLVAKTEHRTGIHTGANPRYLNNQMMQILQANSAWYVEMIARDSFHAWQESNKFFISTAADMFTGLAYVSLLGSSLLGASNSQALPSSMGPATGPGAVPIRAPTLAGRTPPLAQLPNNNAQIKHIFNNRIGHLPDTPANRQLLINTAGNPNNILGIDRWGTKWFASTQRDGTQVWVQVRNGTIQNGGVNSPPKSWNPVTGLSSPTRPMQ